VAHLEDGEGHISIVSDADRLLSELLVLGA
jgi:hypothetical protein